MRASAMDVSHHDAQEDLVLHDQLEFQVNGSQGVNQSALSSAMGKERARLFGK